MAKFWVTRIGSVLLALGMVILLDRMVHQVFDDYIVRMVTLAGLYVTLSVSLNLINGITGQFSIGHAGFYMIGAYTAGALSKYFYEANPFDAPLWVIMMLLSGAMTAAIAGIIVGLPSLRLKGDYLAIVTLGFGEIIRIIAINQEQVGGAYGFNFAPKFPAIWLVWLLAIVCIAVCRNLLKTAHGLAFLAVREDEVAAQAMGVNLTKTKVIAFVVGAAFAGAAGALFAHNEGFLTPDFFKMEVSFLVLTMVVIGGTGSITGAVLAGATLFAIPELPRILPFTITLGMLLGLLIGVVAMVASIRRITSHYHGPRGRRGLITTGAVVGSMVGGALLGAD
ncbi:branched-chain amino acid ABC transporter permease [Geitlerinema splendidum]|nr:branched-chain amino acid ABC transporter permease [Geitlerinema splendidum]